MNRKTSGWFVVGLAVTVFEQDRFDLRTIMQAEYELHRSIRVVMAFYQFDMRNVKSAVFQCLSE